VEKPSVQRIAFAILRFDVFDGRSPYTSTYLAVGDKCKGKPHKGFRAPSDTAREDEIRCVRQNAGKLLTPYVAYL
jgi:hypothetical protein